MQYKKYKQYRLPGCDYSDAGDYFITVCTKDRLHYFGKIFKTNDDAVIDLTAIGACVAESILSIPDTFPGVVLGETVVMPNHIHLIITLPFKESQIFPEQSYVQQIMSPHNGLKPLTPGSVSSIINHLKGRVKKWCNANRYDYFQWQSRFYDHVVRNVGEYNRISNYIANNIWNWNCDEDNEDGNNFRKDRRL